MCGSRGIYALGKMLQHETLGGALKIKVHQTIIRPLYGSKTWTLTQTVEQLLSAWERKMLRTIVGRVQDGGKWRSVTWKDELDVIGLLS